MVSLSIIPSEVPTGRNCRQYRTDAVSAGKIGKNYREDHKKQGEDSYGKSSSE